MKAGDYDTLQLLYDDIPDTLSQLIRTAFVPRPGYKFKGKTAELALGYGGSVGALKSIGAFVNGTD